MSNLRVTAASAICALLGLNLHGSAHLTGPFGDWFPDSVFVLGLASAAAGAAVVLVIATGFAARAPLARVPENTMKFAVGVMLCSFGVFWGAEGAGASWPGKDAFLLAIIPAVAGG